MSVNTFDSVISSALNVERDQIKASGTRGAFEKVVLNVRNEAVVPEADLLSGHSGHQLVDDAGC